MFGIDACQRPHDVLGIDDSISRVLPGMRVRASLGRCDRLDAHRGDNQRAAILRRLGQPCHPAFEPETVNDEDPSLGKEPNLIRARLEDVLVRVAADQTGNGDIAAADLVDHVFQDAERDDNPDRGLRCPGGRERPDKDQAKADEAPAYFAGVHRVSYHFSPVASEQPHEPE